MYIKSIFPDLNDSIKKVELQELSKGRTYPVTIIMDRYSGTYSKGNWLAFQLEAQNIPEDIGGGDPDEAYFWRNHNEKELPIGKGNTPQLAHEDLIKKLIIYYTNF